MRKLVTLPIQRRWIKYTAAAAACFVASSFMAPNVLAESVTFAGKNYLTPAESTALSQAFANHYQVPNFQLRAHGAVNVNAMLTRYAQAKNASAAINRQFAKDVDQTMSVSGFVDKAMENGNPILYAETLETMVAGGKKTVTKDVQYGLKNKAYENQGKGWKVVSGKTYLYFMPSGDFDGFPLSASNLTDLRATIHGNRYSYTGTFTGHQIASMIVQLFGSGNSNSISPSFQQFLDKGTKANASFVVSKVGGSFEVAEEKVSIVVDVPISKLIEEMSGQKLPTSVTRGFGNLIFSVAFDETAAFANKKIAAPKGLPGGTTTVTGSVYGNQ